MGLLLTLTSGLVNYLDLIARRLFYRLTLPGLIFDPGEMVFGLSGLVPSVVSISSVRMVRSQLFPHKHFIIVDSHDLIHGFLICLNGLLLI